MNVANAEIRAEYSMAQRATLIYVRDRDTGNDLEIVGPPIGSVRNPAMQSRVATTLDEQAAQTLMDDLWRAGVRPVEGRGSAGQLAATEHHLKDLQSINGRLLDHLLPTEPK